MSRQTYTYKINRDKIRDNLLPRLEEEKNNLKSFSTPIEPLKIIEALQNSHTDFSVTAWRSALDWIFDNYCLEDEFDSSLDHLGFELSYELCTKDKCWVYVSQMAEFRDMNGFDYVYDGTYFLYPNDFFKRYLNYLLILLKKISLDAQYTGFRVLYSENEFCLNDNDIDDILDEQTNRALSWIRQENEREDMIAGKESNYGRSRDRMHYYVAPEMFFQIKELQETLRHYDGNIFIYDSQ